MFAIYNSVTWGSLTMFFFVFLGFFVFVLFSSSYYLFKPTNYINTIMFINITVMGVLEKSIGGEFRARNSSGMVYPYSSC